MCEGGGREERALLTCIPTVVLAALAEAVMSSSVVIMVVDFIWVRGGKRGDGGCVGVVLMLSAHALC